MSNGEKEIMTIKEVALAIYNAKKARDYRYEMTPDNSLLYKQMGEGTFEAVLTGIGNQKCLMPEVGTLHYLYRGQNQEVIPCVPTLYRGDNSDVDIFIERMRLTVFKRLFASHPVINGFFRKHNFTVSEEGLAQHYGLKTSVLDLTSSLDVAFFFATCFYDKKTREYRFFDDGQEHEAILYVFSPILDNEPSPSIKNEIYMNHNIIPIGLQAFPRPGEQQGYALHIEKGNSIKSWMYRFSFTCEDSKYYYDLFNKSKLMWSEKDKLIPYAAKIAGQRSFSFDVFNETFYNYQPKGFSRTKLKASLPSEIQLSSKIPDVKFSSLDIEDRHYID